MFYVKILTSQSAQTLDFDTYADAFGYHLGVLNMLAETIISIEILDDAENLLVHWQKF